MSITPRLSGAFIGSWGGGTTGTPGTPGGDWYGANLQAAYTSFAAWRGRALDLIKENASGSWSGIEGSGVSYIASNTGTTYRNKILLAVGGNPSTAITSRSLTSNVATITIGTHAWVAGDTFTVTATGGTPIAAPFLGTFTVTAVTATTVSYAVTSANVASATVTGTFQASATSWWRSAANGDFDSHYLTLADNIAAAGHTKIWLAFLWEHNLIGNPWYAGTTGDCANFVTFWRRIVPAMVARQAGVTFYHGWCLGAGEGSNGALTELSYPGDDVCPLISCDAYDSNSTGTWPLSILPAYNAATSYAVGAKVSYYAGYYKCIAATTGGAGNHPPYQAQLSNTYWAWYSFASMSEAEQATVHQAFEDGWDYYLNGSGSASSRSLQWIRDFANGTKPGVTLDARATRSGAKPFGLHEWGLYGRAAGREGKDNPWHMNKMIAWMDANIPADGISYESVFVHDVGLSTTGNAPSDLHGMGAPFGDFANFPNAPTVSFPMAGEVYRARYSTATDNLTPASPTGWPSGAYMSGGSQEAYLKAFGTWRGSTCTTMLQYLGNTGHLDDWRYLHASYSYTDPDTGVTNAFAGTNWWLNQYFSSTSPFKASHGKGVVISVPLRPGSNTQAFDWAAGANGDYDTHWIAFCRMVNAWNMEYMMCRLGWERNMNTSSNYAGTKTVTATAQNNADQIAYHNRIAQIIRTYLPHMLIELNFGGGNQKTSWPTIIPDPASFDILSLDMYDLSGAATLDPAARWNLMYAGTNGLKKLEDVATAMGKRISLAEWAPWKNQPGNILSNAGGDAPYHIHAMAGFFASNWAATVTRADGTTVRRLAYENYFNTDPNDGLHMLTTSDGVNTGPNFPLAAAQYQLDWGDIVPPVTPPPPPPSVGAVKLVMADSFMG